MLEQLDAPLTELPGPVLQLLVAMSGTAAVACAASSLNAAWASVSRCPSLVARFLLSRHGAATALYHAYNAPELRRLLESAQSSSGPLSDSHAATPDAAFLCLIKELLKLGAHLKPQARFLLTAAASYGDTRVLDILLRNGADAASCGGRALVAAASGGYVDAMEVLLAAGVSARAENGAALRAACRGGQLPATQLLLRRGADPRAAAGAALVEAAGTGHLAIVLELLAAGADARADGSRALQEAAAGGFAPVVLALLVAGAQPGARNGLALRRAAAGKHSAVVQVLQAAASRDISVPGIAPSAPPLSSSSAVSPASSAGGQGRAAAAAAGPAAARTSPSKGAGGVAAAATNGRGNGGGWSSVAAAALPPAAGVSASRRSGHSFTAPRPEGGASMPDVRSVAAAPGVDCWPGAIAGACANGPCVASAAGSMVAAPHLHARHATQPHSPVCAVAGGDVCSLFAPSARLFNGLVASSAAARMAVGGQSV
ncbi:hypothetical protein HXX76_000183 [Chlamydomonas incerta]|uniref:Uncharacterized protein n=1 Tax=Chlamydomonas incerta TaxID=51695 RepID=A0A835WDU5_CHLIN|nr:hypothetical protein HXX76_000183 [Chlamydomonas incerta]|eukprot:KAG2445571.1 hypothetical protein HXX76_000183 [Chlamydomonas incerta]